MLARLRSTTPLLALTFVLGLVLAMVVGGLHQLEHAASSTVASVGADHPVASDDGDCQICHLSQVPVEAPNTTGPTFDLELTGSDPIDTADRAIARAPPRHQRSRAPPRV